jgi:L-seryl-tRNA(Ser) seleniumtransferase
MKIEPRLPQLPSLGELLEHPRVKGLVERLNRSTIAQRAGGFLEEMRAGLVEKAGHVEVPSLTQLAERLARRLLGEPLVAGPVINATGLVLGDAALAPPVAEAALHAMVQTAAEYHRREEATLRTIERGLSELAGSEAAILVRSFEAALALALAATAEGREIVLCGADDVTRPVDWRRLAARAGAVLRTDGQAGEAAAVVRAPEGEGVDLAVLAGAKTAGACVIDAAPFAGVRNPSEFGYQGVATIGERLAAGADVVIVDGAALLGGPACGVVFGSRADLSAMARHALVSLVAVDALVAPTFSAVLALYRDDANLPVVYQLPLWQLLSAPAANGQQRAERLAALMASGAGVAGVSARVEPSEWIRWGEKTWSRESWIVEVRPAHGDVPSLVARLAQGPHPIVPRASTEAVLLDLRTVFPRWDQQLAAAVSGTQN